MAALFMRREERLNAEQKEYLERLGAADVALNDARRGIRHQAPEEAGLRESELGPAKGEGIGSLVPSGGERKKGCSDRRPIV